MRKKFIVQIILVVSLVVFFLNGDTGLVAAEDGKTPLNVPRVEGKVRVNGVMDEALWQEALKLELAYEISPGENIAPPVRTEVFIAYGKAHLYLAFRAFDSDPSAIRALLTDRDNIADNDWVSVRLDTFNDQRRSYNFSCNPLGVQAEAVEANSGTNDGWDAIWASAGRIVKEGYVVEMAIPFRSLRFQRKDDVQVWGFDARRFYPRSYQHTFSITPNDRNNNCSICQMKKISGFKGARVGRNIELDPSVSGHLYRERADLTGDQWEKDSKLEPGITAHWGFTPNMTLSAAVNPDFSNVEADVAQLNINTLYALYYPEKRPFFMEGSSLFETPLQAIYTRAIAVPDWGVKLTGKEGGHAVGFYTARDSITNLLYPSSQGSVSSSLEGGATGSVLRYRYDVGKASTVGVLATDREGKDYFNRLVGADVYWRFSRKKFVNAQFLTSQTRYPESEATAAGQPLDKFNGTALDFVFRHESRNIGYYATYQQVTPGFRADLGFMPKAGFRLATGNFIYASWKGPGHWYSFINVAPTVEYEVDFDGEVIYKAASVSSYYVGPSQIGLYVKGALGKEGYYGRMFDSNFLFLSFSIRPSNSLKLLLDVIYGDQIDYSNAREGAKLSFRFETRCNLGRHFSMSLAHEFERLNVDAGRLYSANITNLNLVYQFNRRFFLRSILQYVDYAYNVEHYSFPMDPKYKHLFTQVLFSYRLNPQTMVFLGYSDDHYGYSTIPVTQSNSTVFLKVGYALSL
ncbi:MAG: carbohydrate binding family 9 domain-containing protein [bacterium]|nr:carbohydrate binding family 9 domain-containing protein [bacterium]